MAMIKKEQLKNKDLNIVDREANHSDEQAQRFEQLKQINPAFIDGDGQINFEAIKNFYGVSDSYSEKQNYQLSFAGKSIANALAQTLTAQELKVEHKQSKNFNDTDNIIIRGDNLDALKILNQNYADKIKMIYIDPPYNTQSDGFIYKDNFSKNVSQLREEYGIDEESLNYLTNVYGLQVHSGWLAFIYPRLKLAKDLLSEDGVIFISIDDHEQANLKLLCDEIFGSDNFVSLICVKMSELSGVKMSHKNKKFPKLKEFLLMYTKSKDVLSINPAKVPCTWEESLRQYKLYVEKIGDDCKKWKVSDLKRYIHDKKITSPEKINEFKIKNAANIFRTAVTAGSNLEKNNYIDIIKKKSGIDMYTYKGEEVLFASSKIMKVDNVETPFIYVGDIWTDISTTSLHNEGGVDFKNGKKPLKLVRRMLESCTNIKEEDIILDFFAGSGTTAEAVMELNQEDGGNRKFIMVQSDEAIDSKKSKESFNFCESNNLAPVISSICIERANRAGEKLQNGKDVITNHLDIGYKVFSLIEKPVIAADDELSLVSNRSTTYDTLYNMMAIVGTNLSESIEEVEKDKLYKISNDYFVVGECQTDLSSIEQRIHIDGYADINLEKWLNLVGLKHQNTAINVVY